MKGRPYSELEAVKRLNGLIRIEQYGSPDLCVPEAGNLAVHREFARRGLARSREAVIDDAYSLVVLDELPYGNFIEIEGPDGSSIQKVARNLNLNWKVRVMTSYTYLYEALKKERPELEGKYLTFKELKGMRFMPDELGVSPADLP